MVTPLAFQTSMPLRPAPPLVSCNEGSDGQGWLAVPLLPSIMTLLRSRPRMCRPGFWIQTPAVGHCVLFSWYTPGQIRIQAPRLAASTAFCTVEYTDTPPGHGMVLPLQTSSTLLPVSVPWAGTTAARAWLPAIAGAPASVSAKAAPISHHRLIMVLPSPTSRVCSSPDISAMTGQYANNRPPQAAQSRRFRCGQAPGQVGSPGPWRTNSDIVCVFSTCRTGNGMPVRSLFAMHHIWRQILHH